MSAGAGGGGSSYPFASGGGGMHVEDPPSSSIPSTGPIKIGVQISAHMGFILTERGDFFKTTALTRESTTPHPGTAEYSVISPYDFIDVITFATAVPGYFSTGEEAEVLKHIFTNLSKYSPETHQENFPALNLHGSALIKPADLLRIFLGKTIYTRAPTDYTLGLRTALSISSYIPNKTPSDQALTGYLSFIKSSEHKDLVKIGGINDLNSGTKYGYDSILDIITNKPFIIDDEVRKKIKSTQNATFEEMIPFLVNYFTFIYGRPVKLKLYFTGCGKIGKITEPSDTYTPLTNMDNAAVESLSGAAWDGSRPNIIEYSNKEQLSEIINAHLRVPSAGAGRGGARKTLKRNRRARSSKGSKKLANRRHIVRHRRRPYSRTKSQNR